MKSDAKKRADARFNAKAYEQIKLYSRREDRLRDLIAVAAGRLGVSSGEYIRHAIRVQLERDGVTLDALDDETQDAGEDG